ERQHLAGCRQVPDLDLARFALLAAGLEVAAARGEPAPVRAEGHGVRLAVVAAEDELLPAGRRVPEPHRQVEARRGQAAAVGAEGQADDNVRVAADAQQFLAAVGFPDLDLSGPAEAAAAGRDPAAVGAEGDAVHLAGGAAEAEQLAAGAGVPDLD